MAETTAGYTNENGISIETAVRIRLDGDIVGEATTLMDEDGLEDIGMHLYSLLVDKGGDTRGPYDLGFYMVEGHGGDVAGRVREFGSMDEAKREAIRVLWRIAEDVRTQYPSHDAWWRGEFRPSVMGKTSIGG